MSNNGNIYTHFQNSNFRKSDGVYQYIKIVSYNKQAFSWNRFKMIHIMRLHMMRNWITWKLTVTAGPIFPLINFCYSIKNFCILKFFIWIMQDGEDLPLKTGCKWVKYECPNLLPLLPSGSGCSKIKNRQIKVSA